MENAKCFAKCLMATIATFLTTTSVGFTFQPGGAMPFELRENHRIVVPVRVNGQGPFDFLLDTGAEVSVIDKKVAKKLGLRRMVNTRLRHYTGVTEVPLAAIESMAVGSHAVEEMKIIYFDLKQVWGIGGGIQGVLGQDFLSKFNYLIDCRKRYIRLDRDGDLRTIIRGARIPCERNGGKLYVSIPSTGEGNDGRRFLLDSGSPYLVVYEVPGTLPDLDIIRVEEDRVAKTSIGRRRVRVCRLGTFRLGGVILKDLTVRITPAQTPGNRYSDGLLPLHVFGSIYVDSRDGYVVLNPRQSE